MFNVTDMFKILGKINPIILLFLMGISILAFKYKFILLRNNRNKTVEILEVKDSNRLLVKNIYYFLIKIDFWKKIIKSEKIISYMENKREICLLAIPNGNYINDKRRVNEIKDILKEYINKNAKIKYKANRNKELPLYKKLVLMRNYDGLKAKIKYFLGMFTFQYDYYFSVKVKKEELSKKIIEETGIWDDSGEFSYFKFYQYQSVIRKAKETQKNKKFRKLHKENLKAVRTDELIGEKLEN